MNLIATACLGVLFVVVGTTIGVSFENHVFFKCGASIIAAIGFTFLIGSYSFHKRVPSKIIYDQGSLAKEFIEELKRNHNQSYLELNLDLGNRGSLTTIELLGSLFKDYHWHRDKCEKAPSCWILNVVGFSSNGKPTSASFIYGKPQFDLILPPSQSISAQIDDNDEAN